jgi:hypothetical protein
MAKFETLKEYKDAGYTVSPLVGMSNPPTYTLTSPDGEVIKFRPKMKLSPFGKRPRKPETKPKDKPNPKIRGLGKSAAEKIKKFLETKKPKKAKGGMVKKYMGGGEVKTDSSPNSGMITKRGWGASRKT